MRLSQIWNAEISTLNVLIHTKIDSEHKQAEKKNSNAECAASRAEHIKKAIEVIDSNNRLVIIAIMAFEEDKTIY